MREASRPKRAYNRRVPEPQQAAAKQELPDSAVLHAPYAQAQGFESSSQSNVNRPPMRSADPRADSRARADARAQQLMGDIDIENARDRFDAPPAPDGWTYEWKALEVLGKEDPSRNTELARMGWEPVAAERHPETMPGNWRGPITRDGMILMERPKQITDKVKQRDRDEANRLVRSARDRMNEAKPGTFDRVDQHGREMAKVKSDWQAPIAVPE